MAGYDKARSVNGVALRVSRLNSEGEILPGDNSVYTQKSFMSFSWTPEYEEGEEITEKNADGSICYSSQDPSTLKRVTLSLSICSPHPELEQLLVGGDVLYADGGDSGEVMGYAAPEAGATYNDDGIAIEAWSKAMDSNGKPATPNRYYHWVFPFGNFTRTGEGVMENGLMTHEFEGWATGNAGLRESLTDWDFTTASPYQYARTNTAPVDVDGWTPVGGDEGEPEAQTLDDGFTF